jgi:hypothetical protein
MLENKKLQITDIKLGEYKKYLNSVGDTWDPTWAEDDNLYFPGNDGTGWDKKCSSNLNFNKASGNDFFNLKGETVNGLTEYGGWAKEEADECNWKSSGCICVDGVLYLAVGRHRYGRHQIDPHFRQMADRASIIKSYDYGLTWQRSAKENYEDAMFKSGRFATPYFIHYGRDGAAPDTDNAQKYIYAISNNGFWCNGDNYILGRVERSKLGNLDASDWEFYTGGDGMEDGSWSREMDAATLIIDSPLKCGETGATYIPSIGRYVLIAWYYPGNPNIDTDRTHFAFYEAPKPWGPWELVKETVNWPEGWYCPRILSKWQSENGSEVDVVAVTGGDYWLGTDYKFTVVPVTLKTDGKYPEPFTNPLPVVVNDDETGDELNKFKYVGQWAYEKARIGAYGKDEHYSDKAGDYFIISFSGSRIKWYGSRRDHMGIAAVSIDNGAETEVDQHYWLSWTSYGRMLFDSGVLEKGIHTLKVRVTGKKNEHSKGTVIFSDRVEIFE